MRSGLMMIAAFWAASAVPASASSIVFYGKGVSATPSIVTGTASPAGRGSFTFVGAGNPAANSSIIVMRDDAGSISVSHEKVAAIGGQKRRSRFAAMPMVIRGGESGPARPRAAAPVAQVDPEHEDGDDHIPPPTVLPR